MTRVVVAPLYRVVHDGTVTLVSVGNLGGFVG